MFIARASILICTKSALISFSLNQIKYFAVFCFAQTSAILVVLYFYGTKEIVGVCCRKTSKHIGNLYNRVYEFLCEFRHKQKCENERKYRSIEATETHVIEKKNTAP